MIVVDTNVIAYLFLTGDHSEASEQVLRKDSVWVAPHLWRSEFRNILSLYIRQQILTLGDALQIMGGATELMHAGEYNVVSEQVVTLATRYGCSAYDAEFITLAEELNIPLVTADKQLLKKLEGQVLSPEEFLSK